MDIKELIGTKETDIKETARINRIENSIVNAACNEVNTKLASYLGNIKLINTESKLTEFSKDKFSGSLRATLCVNTRAGLKKLPIQFKVKASVPTMVETPMQVLAELDKAKGSYEDEVNAIIDNQIKATAYHNEDEEVIEETENIEKKAERLPGKKYKIDINSILDEYVGAEDVGDYYLKDNNLIIESDSGKTTVTLEELGELWGLTNPYWKYDNNGEVVGFGGTYETENIVEAFLDSTITKQAKKKEIDLGVRENLFASEFPVKILTYPKTYLPELKKGDILNVGGLKYKYIGDEPTITGDTENGINARFELVCNEKKASLQVKADTLPDVTPEDISRDTKEGLELKKYLDGLSKEDLSGKDNNEIRADVLLLLDTGRKIPVNYYKRIGSDRRLALWFLSLDQVSIEDLEGDVPASIFDYIKDNAGEAYNVLKKHPSKVYTSYDKLPKFFQDILLTDVSVAVKVANEHPEWVNDKMAELIIDEAPSEAIYLGIREGSDKVINPTFSKFKEYAEGEGITSERQTNEDLGLEDSQFVESIKTDEDDDYVAMSKSFQNMDKDPFDKIRYKKQTRTEDEENADEEEGLESSLEVEQEKLDKEEDEKKAKEEKKETEDKGTNKGASQVITFYKKANEVK